MFQSFTVIEKQNRVRLQSRQNFVHVSYPVFISLISHILTERPQGETEYLFFNPHVGLNPEKL